MIYWWLFTNLNTTGEVPTWTPPVGDHKTDRYRFTISFYQHTEAHTDQTSSNQQKVAMNNSIFIQSAEGASNNSIFSQSAEGASNDSIFIQSRREAHNDYSIQSKTV